MFGDDGLLLFLGALIFFGATWGIGTVTGDLTAVANTLVAVEDGHLHLETLVFTDENGRSPGTRIVDGNRYGRGYAQAILAVPALWALRAVAVLLNPIAIVAAAWSVLVIGFGTQLGSSLDRRRSFTAGGVTVAGGLLAANAALMRPLPAEQLLVLALGLPTVVAGALLVVAVYRLVGSMHGRSAGLAAGLVVLLATPVPFWATVPRYHTLVALLVVVGVTAFYRSRAAGPGGSVRWRALAYGTGGIAVWVHAIDGLVLLTALGLVDVVTHGGTNIRETSTACGALFLSLIPFVITTALTSGAPIASAVEFAGMWRPVELVDPLRWFTVFVRSEFSSTPIAYARFGPVNLKLAGVPLALSAAEAMPLVGLLLAAPVVLYRRWRDGDIERSMPATAERTTDLLVVTYSLLLVVTYLPTLPGESSVTLRRFHPLYPLAVYALFRLPVVRTLRSEWRIFGRVYAGAVIVGMLGYGLLAGAMTAGPHVVAQMNATGAFAVAAILGYWGLVSAVSNADYARSTAVTGGLAAGLTTLFVLLAAFVYLPARRYALPVSRIVTEVLSVW